MKYTTLARDAVWNENCVGQQIHAPRRSQGFMKREILIGMAETHSHQGRVPSLR